MMTDRSLLQEQAGRLGLSLDKTQLDLFRAYYEELVAWNKRVNLTKIVEWEAVQVQHFLDSLTCALVLPAAAYTTPYAIIDVGAGAGFPGLPLKIFLPHARLTLVESVRKKAAFLRHVVDALGLANVAVLNVRAEEAGRDPNHRGRYNLAVCRAVAALATLVEYCLPLLWPRGIMVALKGRKVEKDVAAAGAALEALSGRLREVRPVDLPGLEGPRHLVVVEKVWPTPERYPRRPGLPAKRPLR